MEDTNDLLRLIWQEIKGLGTNLGGRIDETNKRLDETREQLGARLDRVEVRTEQLGNRVEEMGNRVEEMGRRIVESEMRVATEIVTLAGVVRDLKDRVVEALAQRERIDRLEDRVTTLERRSA
jgi:methyl-accepting chemotaxis protein